MLALCRFVCDARTLGDTLYTGGDAATGGLLGEKEYAD